MTVPASMEKLIRTFADNLDEYKRGALNETAVRVQFIDPMFKALGWDVHNEQGYASSYRDVVHEDSLRIGGAIKAPDYAFCIGGARKFFLEAKKGFRGYPIATIALYGPDDKTASKVVASIIVAEGADQEPQKCPECLFWKGRDRWTGHRIH